MTRLPAALPRPSDPALVWELADQERAWRYPPLKVSMYLDSGIRAEGAAEDLLTAEQHRALAEALRAAAAQVTEAGDDLSPR